jgi:hypothetical protein
MSAHNLPPFSAGSFYRKHDRLSINAAGTIGHAVAVEAVQAAYELGLKSRADAVEGLIEALQWFADNSMANHTTIRLMAEQTIAQFHAAINLAEPDTSGKEVP